jgi:hypothetical protein
MIPSLKFRTHLAFYLVQKTIWESRSLTLFQKMKDGWYWDIRGQNIWCEYIRGTDDGVMEIISIECLGLVDTGSNPLYACQQCKHLELLIRPERTNKRDTRLHSTPRRLEVHSYLVE